MKIFTKRNALIGFLAMKAIKARGRKLRSGKRRSAWKLPVLVGLGVVSLGALAVVGAVVLRRQREPEQIEGFVVAGAAEGPVANAFAETEEPSTAE